MALHTRTLETIVVIAGLVCATAPVQSGVLEWFRLPSRRTVGSPDTAQSQMKKYLARVLKIEDLQVSGRKSALTSAERRALDSHVLSRIDRCPEAVIVDLSGRATKGIGVLGGSNLTKGEFSPAKGYVGYVSLVTSEPFPTEADQALNLVTKVVGESGLFGLSPEAGPVWKHVEQCIVGQVPGLDGAAQLSANQTAARTLPAESDPEEIPAWSVRGLGELIWKGEPKPLEMGVLVALTRERGGKACRVTHVTGVGQPSKGLFSGAIRLNKDEEE